MTTIEDINNPLEEEIRPLRTKLQSIEEKWGSAYASHLRKIQVKQNHIVRLMFFVSLYGKNTDSALPLLNLLDLLTVENIFTLQLLKFSHQWHKKQLPNIFDNRLRYASDVHTYNTRYAARGNFYKACFRTNNGKKHHQL